MPTKLYDLVIAKKTGENQTFWRTIGTVFGDEKTFMAKANGKPITFSIDFPECSGIIVPRKKKGEKAETENEQEEMVGADNPDNY